MSLSRGTMVITATLVLFMLAACSDGVSGFIDEPMGTINSPCFEDGTCNEGLACVSGVCTGTSVCNVDSECENGFSCVENQCVEEETPLLTVPILIRPQTITVPVIDIRKPSIEMISEVSHIREFMVDTLIVNTGQTND